MSRKILVGADPEIFVLNGDNALVSAFGMNAGTKYKPLIVDSGAIQVDGMALEYNIDPASSEKEFVDKNRTVLALLSGTLPANHALAYGVTTAHFGAAYIAAQLPEARELGCDPDYNAYTGEVNAKPDVDTPFRTAAGHFHVGFCEGSDPNNSGHRIMCNDLIRELDVFLGIPSVLLDSDTDRRSLYGAAGACRYKSYGVEYRTLSNFWVGNDMLSAWVYRQVQLAVESLLCGTPMFSQVKGKLIQGIINDSSVASARDVIKRFGLEVPNNAV